MQETRSEARDSKLSKLGRPEPPAKFTRGLPESAELNQSTTENRQSSPLSTGRVSIVATQGIKAKQNALTESGLSKLFGSALPSSPTRAQKSQSIAVPERKEKRVSNETNLTRDKISFSDNKPSTGEEKAIHNLSEKEKIVTSTELEFFIAEYDHPKGRDEEIELREGDIVCLLERTSDEWYYVTCDGNLCGFVAAAFLSPYAGEPPEHLKACAFVVVPVVDMNIEEKNENEGSSVDGLDASSSDNIGTANTFGSKIKKTSGKLFKLSRTTSRKSVPCAIVRQDSTSKVFGGNSSTANSEPSSSDLSQRENVAKEILSSERHFVAVLDVLVNDYKQTLIYALDNFSGSLTEQDIEILFGNASLILPLSRTFLEDLEFVVNDWTDSRTLGDIFIRFAPFLKMFNQYAAGYNSAMALLARCFRNELFAQLVHRVESASTMNSRLESLLIAPIQRITRYGLLLEELRKGTPEDHADAPLLDKAIPLLDSVASGINNTVDRVQSQSKQLNLANRGSELERAHRKLIEEGVLMDSFTKKKIRLILFNDIIVHTSETKAKKGNNLEKNKYQWPLHLVWIDSATAQKNSFSLIGPNASYLLTSEEHSVWIVKIRKAIEEYLEGFNSSRDCTILALDKTVKMTLEDPKRYGRYNFSNNYSYIGWWSKGKFDGIGTSEFMSGSYEGSWRDGDRCGQGVMTFVTGDIYNGEWNNDLPEGYGVLNYANGDSYKGHWKRGRKHGKGVLECKNGTVYDGEFEEDLPHGYGKKAFKDGTLYKGNWKFGLRCGNGKYVFANGDTYNGEWSDDRFNGIGILKYNDGRQYDGEWNGGLFHGNGLLKDVSATYEGNFANGLMEGQGKIFYKSGVSYKGNLKEGMYHGTGTITYKVGITREYTGEWYYNKRHGTGIIQLFSGDVFHGSFRHNLMHGNGTYTWKNGVMLKSKWKKGVISQSCDSTVVIPEKNNATPKSFTGTYQRGRLISPSNIFPPIILPRIPVTDILP